MDIRNCPKCKQVFTYFNSQLCPKCEKEEEEIFETVRKYIIDNPHCKMTEVCEATGASLKKITRYLKEGRLEISKGMHGELMCELCGKEITKGKFCGSCAVQISQDMSVLFDNKKKSTGPRIHTQK